MTLTQAVELINSHPNLSATEVRGKIEVSVFGRPAGCVTADEIDHLGHTATGWGKNMRKGAFKVWQALTTAR